jgi:hypothetical protein
MPLRLSRKEVWLGMRPLMRNNAQIAGLSAPPQQCHEEIHHALTFD